MSAKISVCCHVPNLRYSDTSIVPGGIASLETWSLSTDLLLRSVLSKCRPIAVRERERESSTDGGKDSTKEGGQQEADEEEKKVETGINPASLTVRGVCVCVCVCEREVREERERERERECISFSTFHAVGRACL